MESIRNPCGISDVDAEAISVFVTLARVVSVIAARLRACVQQISSAR